MDVAGTTPLDDLDDALLVARSADGDVRAFTALMRRHGGIVRGYSMRLLGSAADADDVVQETFVTAWAQLSTLQDGSAVRSWLMRIASRKAFSLIRARKEHDELPVDVEGDDRADPEAEYERTRQRSDLAAALSALPRLQQRSWVLKEVGGYTYEEIAEQLGVPVSTVRGALARTRKHLVAQMGAWR